MAYLDSYNSRLKEMQALENQLLRQLNELEHGSTHTSHKHPVHPSMQTGMVQLKPSLSKGKGFTIAPLNVCEKNTLKYSHKSQVHLKKADNIKQPKPQPYNRNNNNNNNNPGLKSNPKSPVVNRSTQYETFRNSKSTNGRPQLVQEYGSSSSLPRNSSTVQERNRVKSLNNNVRKGPFERSHTQTSSVSNPKYPREQEKKVHHERDNLFSDDESQEHSLEDMLLVDDDEQVDIYTGSSVYQYQKPVLIQQSDPCSGFSSSRELQTKQMTIENLSQITNRNIRNQSQLDSREKMECTFQPTILSKSKKIAQNLQPSFERLTAPLKSVQPKDPHYKQYMQKEKNNKIYSRERLTQLSKPRQVPLAAYHQAFEADLKEKSQCTFRPCLSKKSAEMFNGNYLDVVSRNQLWEEQRQVKIMRLREEEQREKALKQEMSAQEAAIWQNEQKRMAAAKELQLSRFAKEGLVNYFQRLQTVQEKKKKQQEALAKFSGKKWKKEPTQPKEFQLSKSKNKENKNTNNHSMTNTTLSASQGYCSSRIAPGSSAAPGYKKEYDKAVQELHKKILQLDI